MKENDETVNVERVSDLPPEVRIPVMRDAAEFIRRHKEHGDEWLCETLALLKYQVEGAHVRLDELRDMAQNLMRQMAQDIPNLDDDDDADWWKNG